MKCTICNNTTGNIPYEPKEMMFGLKASFLYFQCRICKCLQIEEIPKNIEDYYPKEYYSFQRVDEKKNKRFKNAMFSKRIEATLFKKGIFGSMIHWLFPTGNYELLKGFNLQKKNKILDVGAGNGAVFLYGLAEAGFTELLGIDPFLEADIVYKNGLKILKKNFHEVEDIWDYIIFHHSFEHMPDPHEVFKSIEKKLAQNGTCMIVIPIVPSYAWRRYGINWFQLDAPRHLYLHSIESINRLASSYGLKVDRIFFNSNYYQFLGSEKYMQGISLIEQTKNKYKENLIKRKFAKWKFKKLAKEVNKKGEGDQAAFYISRI